MTAIDLLNALKAYMEDKVKDMRLIARVPENGTDPGERPPLVFIGNLPNKEQEKKAAPYILLKLLTKKVDDEENVCRVRIICVTFSEDKNENYMQCLTVIALYCWKAKAENIIKIKKGYPEETKDISVDLNNINI